MFIRFLFFLMPEKGVLARFDSFVKELSKSDRIALIHDLDADGISSGAITINAIRLLRGKGPDAIITQPFKTVELLPKTIAELRKRKINKIVCVDFALDQH